MTHLLPPHAVALVYLILLSAVGQPLQVTCHRHGVFGQRARYISGQGELPYRRLIAHHCRIRSKET